LSRLVHILGVPLDHGAGRRGVGMGPSALRVGGLHQALSSCGYTVTDCGDLDIAAPETLSPGNHQARYLALIASVCEQVCRQVTETLRAGSLPLVIGGDHSVAIGTLSGIAAHARAAGSALQASAPGLIWFDAHCDINTPLSSPSGNIHGMPLACLLGHGPDALTGIGFTGAKLDPAHCVLIGVRDIDVEERHLVKAAGIRIFTIADIDKRGMAAVTEEALTIAHAPNGLLHVSFDVDVLDPDVAPGTGTTKPGGLTYREAHLAMEIVADCGRMTSMEMVEVNPTLDEHNRTAELAVELIASALGKRIL
jgi:arginase